MKTLQQIWEGMEMKSDKGDIHSYLPVYEEILAPYRHTAENVLEIGVFKGASLLMWEKYFTKAKVHGIDCDEQPHGGIADLRPLIAEGTHNIHILDATNEFQIHQAFRGMTFQVICDDGGHNLFSQLKSYEILSKYLDDNGLYIIEDVQDIDVSREMFHNIDPTKEVTILDRRHVKGRYDDTLIIIRN